MAKKFNLAALVPEMDAVSNSDSPRITMIPITELRPNGGNFYDTSNFEDLADSIELNGLLEPLCVFRRGQGTGHYVIFSGHRRFKALRLLYEKSGFEKWTEVPCIVYPDPHDANRETVMLIHANSTGRVLSNWEKAQQALRLKKALVAMREGGAELPGRIRDLVAEEMQMSASKLARLEAIGNRLTYRPWVELWKAGELNESVAYRLSMLEWEEQKRVWLWLSENRPGLSAEKIALKDVEAAINPEPEEDETEDVSNSDTGEEYDHRTKGPGLSGRQYRNNGRSGIPGEAGGFVHSCGTHRWRRRIRTAGNLRYTELCRRAGGRRGAERDREEGHEPLCRGNKHFRLPAEQRLRVYGHEQKALPLSGGI